MIAAVLLAGLLAGLLLAQDQTRVDLYSADSTRQGYAIVDKKTGRVDTFDANSKRTGYGVIRSDGRLDLYDTKSRRRETITPRK